MTENRSYNARTMVEKEHVHDEEVVIEEGEHVLHEDDVELEEEEGLTRDKLKAMREKLRACEVEKTKHQDDLQRARADFLNSKRRLEEQLLRDRERSRDGILTELLTLADSFDTAMMNAEAWQSLDATWRTGIEAIQSKLTAILKSNGVEEINPVGQPFSPHEHEAVSSEAVEDEQVDTVIRVLQKGYRRNADILRPARVVVGAK